MNESKMSWLQLLLGVALGLAGLFSAPLGLKVLGGVVILVTMVLGWSQWRSRQTQSDQLSLATPETSMMERWFPFIFFTITVLILLGFTYYTLLSMGLI